MHAMERSEPSLVPEWLRSNGGGGSIHHFASSQAGCSSPSNSRRSSNGNGFSKHDKNSYARSYSSFSRSHRDRDRERSTIGETWDSEYSDPLRGMIRGKVEDPLRRSKSLISRKQGEAPQQRSPTDMRNGVHKNHDNGTYSVGGSATGTNKGSFERDFPELRAEERPKTPDIVRVLSPGLSRGIQSFSIGNPPSVGGEVWTSALAEAPTGPGSNSGGGSISSTAAAAAASSSSASVSTNTLLGLNMAETLVQAPAQSHNAPQPSAQLQKEELALAQSKKLIPVTPLLTKTTALISSDKLKPKTTMRSTETSGTPKNGVHHLAPLQLGSQPVRGASVRGDDPKSPSGKLLVLKPGRENGVSSGLKDLQIPTTNNNIRVANGHSTGSPSKNMSNPRILPGVDKRTSRSNFFKLVREKSLNNTSGSIGSGASASLDVIDKLEKEVKELDCIQVTPDKTGSELNCNGEACTVSDDLSPSMKIDDEEERAFLLSLGWEDNAEDGEEGLTNKEIEAFYNEVMKQGATSRLCRLLQAKLFSQAGCSSSNEPNTSVSQTEA
ncbi:uncharacterized protein LOC141639366 isoform X2 [Silene latifolia]|uniref:uncharacterized protein LOC141639366 isoform X2 n=1 Tax=Silene latifolia TaxID=37657 RepID=UPI003D76CB04